MNNFEQYDKIDTVRDKKKQQQKLLKANEENKIYRNSELTFSRQYVPIQTISSEITHSIPHNGNFVQSNQNFEIIPQRKLNKIKAMQNYISMTTGEGLKYLDKQTDDDNFASNMANKLFLIAGINIISSLGNRIIKNRLPFLENYI